LQPTIVTLQPTVQTLQPTVQTLQPTSPFLQLWLIIAVTSSVSLMVFALCYFYNVYLKRKKEREIQMLLMQMETGNEPRIEKIYRSRKINPTENDVSSLRLLSFDSCSDELNSYVLTFEDETKK